MAITTDSKDPRIKRGGPDAEPTPQHEVYLALSEDERAKGFVRPVRRSYRHVGIAGPGYPVRDLTDDERERYAQVGYVKYEAYPEGGPTLGRFWTQAQLDSIGKGCGGVTTMAVPLAETYAREPSFFGATYCVGCQKHLAVAEFVWEPDGSRVGS